MTPGHVRDENLRWERVLTLRLHDVCFIPKADCAMQKQRSAKDRKRISFIVRLRVSAQT